MDLRFEERDGTLIVRVEGEELGADTAEEVRRTLLAGMGAHAFVILDLSTVTFMDSSGLGVLVAAMKALRGRGELRLIRVNPLVQELFSLTGLNRVFLVDPDETAALAALGGTRRRNPAA
jgi:anti-sigma B factor antagonist